MRSITRNLRKRSAVIAVAGTGLILLGAMLFLFRTVTTEEDSALGTVRYEYRWGRPAFVSVDVNQDGIVDGRFRVPSAKEQPGWHKRYAEGWESSKCDGRMDVHWYYEENDDLTVEVDRDGDQVLETKERGASAQSLLVSIPRAKSCRYDLDLPTHPTPVPAVPPR